MPKSRRTTHRSKKGKKLYAVRDRAGKFKDVETYKRAHGQDVKRRSKAEQAAKYKKAGEPVGLPPELSGEAVE